MTDEAVIIYSRAWPLALLIADLGHTFTANIVEGSNWWPRQTMCLLVVRGPYDHSAHRCSMYTCGTR